MVCQIILKIKIDFYSNLQDAERPFGFDEFLGNVEKLRKEREETTEKKAAKRPRTGE